MAKNHSRPGVAADLLQNSPFIEKARRPQHGANIAKISSQQRVKLVNLVFAGALPQRRSTRALEGRLRQVQGRQEVKDTDCL